MNMTASRETGGRASSGTRMTIRIGHAGLRTPLYIVFVFVLVCELSVCDIALM